MNRRNTLHALLGKSNSANKKNKLKAIPKRNPVSSGLEPYAGQWNYQEAAHLLRRTMFGPTKEQINQAVSDGLDQTIDMLLSSSPDPEPPVNYYFEDDPNVPIGESWVDAPYSTSVNLFGYRRRSFFGWLMKNIYEEGVSIKEKMLVFWHNHYVTADINDSKFDFRYFSTLRSNVLGNFKQFTKEITVDPSMLRFLNGNQNTKNAPNENFARELLELFTIGKGPLIGPGDYTNYTEGDISEVARVLTGWRDRGFRSLQGAELSSYFRSNKHDTGQKKLSSHFGNAVIDNMGDAEYNKLIDIIFREKEVARFLSRKLYRWFIYYVIDEETENMVIEPLADILYENDFEIVPALQTLLKSQHFYDFINNGCLIKSPLDFVFSTFKTLKIQLPEDDLFTYYSILLTIANYTSLLQMTYGDPPSVAGWKAYYQQPSFNEVWINSVTLPLRMNLTKVLVLNGFNQGGRKIIVDVLNFVDNLENPSDVNALIEELVQILFPQDITEKQKLFLIDYLIPGLPEFEWTVEYLNYKNNPDDENLKKSMENKLRLFLNAMLSMPEFYLS